jgi:hypothetical protein
MPPQPCRQLETIERQDDTGVCIRAEGMAMTAKLLASGMAALAAIGAVAVGMSPVAMASDDSNDNPPGYTGGGSWLQYYESKPALSSDEGKGVPYDGPEGVTYQENILSPYDDVRTKDLVNQGTQTDSEAGTQESGTQTDFGSGTRESGTQTDFGSGTRESGTQTD